jgi:O-antigen/teichoic acid export membrane protein
VEEDSGAAIMQSGNRLDHSMGRALVWNAAAKAVSQVFSWLSTIVVARLLTPYDYGLIGMAGVYLALATLVSQTGIGNAVLYVRDLTRRQIAELNTVSLLLGVFLTGLTCALAAPLARFFNAPPLRAVVLAASITYSINALQVVPRALLQRELRFKLLSSIETVRFLCQALCSVILAWLNFRYWSLVLGHIIGGLIGTILTLLWKPEEFAFPHFRDLRQELKYARRVLFSGVAGYVYENADFGVAGRVLGEVPLGNYSVAWGIASVPVEKISSLITGVTPAFFSAIQHNKTELRRYLLRLTEALSLATIPASIGLALVADSFVLVLLGPKWKDAIGPLRLLSVFIAIRSVATLLPTLLTAIGDAGFVMWATIGSAIVMPIAFLAGSHWGTIGIAAAWMIAYPVILIPLYIRTFHKTEMRLKDYLSALLPALSASATMTICVLLTRFMTIHVRHPVSNLLLTILVGVTTYLGALFVFHRDRVARLVRTMKSLQERDKSIEV